MDDETLAYLREASEISHKVNNVQNDINSINRQLAVLSRENTGSCAAILSTIFGGWFPGVILVSMLKIKSGSAGIVLFIWAVAIGLGIYLDINAGRKKKAAHDERMAYLQNEANSRNMWISSYLEKHSDVVSRIPPVYFYPIAIDYFIEVLSNGRADTFKEAMNLYEEQLHRWKIEDMTKSSMIAQQQTAANSAAIRTSSAINAAANVANLMRR